MKKIEKLSLSLLLIIAFTYCRGQTALQYYKLGLLNDSLGQPKKAFNYYSLAIKKSPKTPEYYVKRAEARFNMGMTIKAEKEFLSDINNAIRLKVAWYYPAVFVRAKYWYYIANDNEKAIADLDTLVIRNPTQSEIYRLLGEIGIGQRDTVMAYKNYRKLLEIASNKYMIYNEMADFEFIYGFYQQAINHYTLAGKLTNYRTNNLAMCYWKLDKKDDACYYYIEDNGPKLMEEYKALIEYCKRKK